MNPLRILIVDDETLARDRIKSFLSSRAELFSILEARNGFEALSILRTQEIAILFLDIQMPEMNGFEMLAQLENRNFQVIFQTAFDEFAIQAFDENACDYLLKPFSKERFYKSLERAMGQKNNKDGISGLEKSFRKKGSYLEKFTIQSGAKLVLVSSQDILAIVSKDHYTHLVTSDREWIVNLSLDHLEERLDPNKFVRIHRNGIVAIRDIATVIKGDNMKLEISNGLRLPVSRSKRKKVLELWTHSST